MAVSVVGYSMLIDRLLANRITGVHAKRKRDAINAIATFSFASALYMVYLFFFTDVLPVHYVNWFLL